MGRNIFGYLIKIYRGSIMTSLFKLCGKRSGCSSGAGNFFSLAHGQYRQLLTLIAEFTD